MLYVIRYKRDWGRDTEGLKQLEVTFCDIKN